MENNWTNRADRMDTEQTKDENHGKSSWRDRRVPNMYNYLRSYCSFVQTFLNPFHLYFQFRTLSFPLPYAFYIWLPFIPKQNLFASRYFVVLSWCSTSRVIAFNVKATQDVSPVFPRLFL